MRFMWYWVICFRHCGRGDALSAFLLNIWLAHCRTLRAAAFNFLAKTPVCSVQSLQVILCWCISVYIIFVFCVSLVGFLYVVVVFMQYQYSVCMEGWDAWVSLFLYLANIFQGCASHSVLAIGGRLENLLMGLCILRMVWARELD